MTVRDLYNWCKACRYKDAKVYMVGDWEEVDEDGLLTDLYELDDVVTQTQLIDMGLDWEENHAGGDNAVHPISAHTNQSRRKRCGTHCMGVCRVAN